MIGVNVWWDYLAPQNIPSVVTLTLGSEVVLYCVFERGFHFSHCLCSFQGVAGKRQRGVVDQEQILVSNHFHCLDCSLVNRCHWPRWAAHEVWLKTRNSWMRFYSVLLNIHLHLTNRIFPTSCFTKCTSLILCLTNRIFPTNLLLIISTLSSCQHGTSLAPICTALCLLLIFKKKSATRMTITSILKVVKQDPPPPTQTVKKKANLVF